MTGPRIAALVLALALPVAGCGGGDDEADEFRDDYNAAVERLNQVSSNLQESADELASKSGAQISREFARIADTADETRERLQALDPPQDARDEFDRLLPAVDKWVTDVRAMAKAARTQNPDRFEAAAEALSESGEELDQAEEALRDAVDG